MQKLKQLLMLGLLATGYCLAQDTLTVTASPAVVRPGQTTTITLSLAGSPVVSDQWTLVGPTGWALGSQAVTPAVGAVPKQLTCGPTTCFIWGLNVLPIPVGATVTANLTAPANALPGPQTVSLSGLVAVSALGSAVTLSGVNATITVLSPFDINGDGQVTVADVNAIVAEVASGTCANDVVGNSQCNVLQVIAEVIAWSATGSKP